MRAAGTPTTFSEDLVLAKCDFLTDVQIWPLLKDADPAAWLRNFLDSEQEHALCLLHAFSYFSEGLTNELFRTAVQSLSAWVSDPLDARPQVEARWRAFLDRVLVTPVEGETPNITDSGYAFARRARQLCGVPQDRIVSNEDALARIAADPTPPPVLFVDDFVGSGQQFIKTWTRERKIAGHDRISFTAMAASRTSDFFYTPLVATEAGLTLITAACSGVQCRPVHRLTERDSALADTSHVWPAHLRPTALRFLEAASARAGIADWKGFADLGLTIGFAHSVPDATLPLYYWEQNNWTPLVRRR